MKNFVQEGNVMHYAAGAPYSAGDVVVLSGIGCGVAAKDIASGESGPVSFDGVFKVTKEAPLVIAQGARVYWDGTKATTTVGTNTLMGFAFKAGASADTELEVKLVPMGDTEPGNSAQAAVVAALAGTLTGTTDGTITDVAAVSTAGGNTYADSAINTAITSINLQHKELQTSLNAILTSLKAAGLMASS